MARRSPSDQTILSAPFHCRMRAISISIVRARERSGAAAAALGLRWTRSMRTMIAERAPFGAENVIGMFILKPFEPHAAESRTGKIENDSPTDRP